MTSAKCDRYCDGLHYRVGQLINARGVVVFARALMDEADEVAFDSGHDNAGALIEGATPHVQLVRCEVCNPEPVTDPELQKPAGKSARLKLHSTEPDEEPEPIHGRLPYPDN